MGWSMDLGMKGKKKKNLYGQSDCSNGSLEVVLKN